MSQDESFINKYRDVLGVEARIIETTLNSYGIKTRVVDIKQHHDNSIEYQLEIAIGVKIEDIENRLRELALALASPIGKVTLVAPIPGRALIGIIIPPRDESYYKSIKTEDNKGPSFLAKYLSYFFMYLGTLAFKAAKILNPGK